MFVDPKAEFDNIDREKMWKVLEEKEINWRRRRIRRRLERIYEVTEVRVRIKKKRATQKILEYTKE